MFAVAVGEGCADHFVRKWGTLNRLLFKAIHVFFFTIKESVITMFAGQRVVQMNLFATGASKLRFVHWQELENSELACKL